MLSGTTILLEVIGFVLWSTFVGRLERWVWWTVWIGYVVLIYHRIGETLGWGVLFGPITSLAFGIISFIAAIETRRLLRKRDEARNRLLQVHQRLAEMELEPPANIAQKLAEIIVDLKDQVKYYEAQASDAGLPTYKSNGNGGTEPPK